MQSDSVKNVTLSGLVGFGRQADNAKPVGAAEGEAFTAEVRKLMAAAAAAESAAAAKTVIGRNAAAEKAAAGSPKAAEEGAARLGQDAASDAVNLEELFWFSKLASAAEEGDSGAAAEDMPSEIAALPQEDKLRMGNELIAQALKQIAAILGLPEEGDAPAAFEFDPANIEQLAAIMAYLDLTIKMANDRIDVSANAESANMAMAAYGMESPIAHIEPEQNAAELSEFAAALRTEKFRMDMAFRLIGVSGMIAEKITEKSSIDGAAVGIPQAVNPADLGMSVADTVSAFSNLIREELSASADRVRQIVRGQAEMTDLERAAVELGTVKSEILKAALNRINSGENAAFGKIGADINTGINKTNVNADAKTGFNTGVNAAGVKADVNPEAKVDDKAGVNIGINADAKADVNTAGVKVGVNATDNTNAKSAAPSASQVNSAPPGRTSLQGGELKPAEAKAGVNTVNVKADVNASVNTANVKADVNNGVNITVNTNVNTANVKADVNSGVNTTVNTANVKPGVNTTVSTADVKTGVNTDTPDVDTASKINVKSATPSASRVNSAPLGRTSLHGGELKTDADTASVKADVNTVNVKADVNTGVNTANVKADVNSDVNSGVNSGVNTTVNTANQTNRHESKNVDTGVNATVNTNVNTTNVKADVNTVNTGVNTTVDTDAGAEIKTDANTVNAKADANTVNTGVGTNVNTEAKADVDTGANTAVNAEIKTGADTVDVEAGVNTTVNTNVNTTVNTAIKTDVNTVVDTGVNTGNANTEADAKADVNTASVNTAVNTAIDTDAADADAVNKKRKRAADTDLPISAHDSASRKRRSSVESANRMASKSAERAAMGTKPSSGDSAELPLSVMALPHGKKAAKSADGEAKKAAAEPRAQAKNTLADGETAKLPTSVMESSDNEQAAKKARGGHTNSVKAAIKAAAGAVSSAIEADAAKTETAAANKAADDALVAKLKQTVEAGALLKKTSSGKSADGPGAKSAANIKSAASVNSAAQSNTPNNIESNADADFSVDSSEESGAGGTGSVSSASSRTAAAAGRAEKADAPAASQDDRFEVIRQLSEKMNNAVRAGANEVRMVLRPEALGEVRMSLRVQGDVVFARMQVENKQVKAIVESNLQSLKDSLNRQNLEFGAIDVEVGAESDGDKSPRELWQEMEDRAESRGFRQAVAVGVDGSPIEAESDRFVSLGSDTGRRFGANTFEYFA